MGKNSIEFTMSQAWEDHKGTIEVFWEECLVFCDIDPIKAREGVYDYIDEETLRVVFADTWRKIKKISKGSTQILIWSIREQYEQVLWMPKIVRKKTIGFNMD